MTDDCADSDDDVNMKLAPLHGQTIYYIKATNVTIIQNIPVAHCEVQINSPTQGSFLSHGSVPAKGSISVGAAASVDGYLTRTYPPPSVLLQHLSVPVTNGQWSMTFTEVPAGQMLLTVSCGCGSGSVSFTTF
jgi:hypothetical protein